MASESESARKSTRPDEKNMPFLKPLIRNFSKYGFLSPTEVVQYVEELISQGEDLEGIKSPENFLKYYPL